MAIKMAKATRVAVKTAKSLDELATEVATMREQLNRIEDMLLAKVEAVEEVPAPVGMTMDEAKVAFGVKPTVAKTPARTQKKGG